jgi:hypothetical protein
MSAPAKAKNASLDSVYETLHQLLSRHAPPFKTKSGTIRAKKDLHLTVLKAVVLPGAYGGKPTELAMASIILQKSYVGFYFTPIYMQPALKNKLAPSLTRLLKGKTCFYIKKVDPDLVRNIESALQLGTKFFQDRGWVE